jgi:hypothetical protein
MTPRQSQRTPAAHHACLAAGGLKNGGDLAITANAAAYTVRLTA